MPHDPDLLEPLGLVVWASARLHAGIRDAIGRLAGALSDTPFDDTLGTSRRDLEAAARVAGRSDVVDWCAGPGLQAVRARNGVMHAVAYTADDGKQAIRSTRRNGDSRYLVGALLDVADHLVDASRTLPVI